MKKFIVPFALIALIPFVNEGYQGGTHGRIVLKAPVLLENGGYAGVAKYLYYQIYNSNRKYLQECDIWHPPNYVSPIDPDTFVRWGTEVHPVMKWHQTSLGWLIDRLPGSFTLGDTIRCWINENGIRDIGMYAGGVFLIAGLFWFWGPGLTFGEALTSDLLGIVGQAAFVINTKSNYLEPTYGQNLAVSAMWPDNFATFGDKNAIYLGFCPLAHGRSTSPQTFWTIGHAHNICEEYYNWAKQEWLSGNRTQALRWLGRACHFIQDGVQPNHRAPAGFYGLMAQKGHKGYEDTCDIVSLSETQFYPNSAALNPNFDVSDKVVELGNTTRGYLHFCVMVYPPGHRGCGVVIITKKQW